MQVSRRGVDWNGNHPFGRPHKSSHWRSLTSKSTNFCSKLRNSGVHLEARFRRRVGGSEKVTLTFLFWSLALPSTASSALPSALRRGPSPSFPNCTTTLAATSASLFSCLETCSLWSCAHNTKLNAFRGGFKTPRNSRRTVPPDSQQGVRGVCVLARDMSGWTGAWRQPDSKQHGHPTSLRVFGVIADVLEVVVVVGN